LVISEQRLSTLITEKELKDARISRAAFAWRVKRNFCPAMTKNGTCTKVCQNCQEPLQGALLGILPRVRSPEAVITWRLRGAAAIVAERKSKTSKEEQVHRDELGFKLPKSAGFDTLAKKLGVR